MEFIKTIKTLGSKHHGLRMVWNKIIEKGYVCRSALTVNIIHEHLHAMIEPKKYELCSVSIVEMSQNSPMTVGDFLDNINRKDVWKITDIEAALIYFFETVDFNTVAIMPIGTNTSLSDGERKMLVAIINPCEIEFAYISEGLVLNPEITFVLARPDLFEADPEDLAKNKERIERDRRTRNAKNIPNPE